MEIFVCVGSSCHLKGSHKIIELLKERLSEDNLINKVELKATFCLGHCATKGVSIKVDEEVITGVNEDNFKDIYKKYIFDVLN